MNYKTAYYLKQNKTEINHQPKQEQQRKSTLNKALNEKNKYR